MARLPNGCSRMLCALAPVRLGGVGGEQAVAADRAHAPQRAADRLVEALLVGELIDEVVTGDDHDRRAHHVEPEDRTELAWPAAPDAAPARRNPATACCRQQASSAVAGSGSIGCLAAIEMCPPAFVSSFRHCGRSEAIQIMHPLRQSGLLRRSRFSHADGEAQPNRLLRHSISLALTSSGFSCCVQWPLSLTRYFSRSGDQLLHAVGGRWRQHGVVLRHDHQRRNVDVCGRAPCRR